MLDAFVELCALAIRSGADAQEVYDLQYRFFDGNVAVKDALGPILLLAEIRR